MDEFSSKTVKLKTRFFKQLNVRTHDFTMDEFSSKTAYVMTRKMKIPENFLDEFSMICQ